MSTINTIRKRLKGIKTHDVTVKSIEATSKDYVKFIVDQLKKGYNKDGILIADTESPSGTSNVYKWESYANEKYAQNPVPGFGNPDMIHTGRFTRDLRIKVEEKFILIDSTDEKNDKLINKYPNILGLGEQSQSEYSKVLRPVFVNTIRKKLKL